MLRIHGPVVGERREPHGHRQNVTSGNGDQRASGAAGSAQQDARKAAHA